MSGNVVNLYLESRYAAKWREYSIYESRIWVRGDVFFENRFCRGDDAYVPFARIASLLENKNYHELIDLLNQLNGFFSVVIQSGENAFAAVDRVRSIPLFYGEAEERVFLSDDAEWIRQNMNVNTMDHVAKQEFLFTGYVTGPDTLFPHVKQLQAGELLHITQGETGPKLKTHRYYRFLHTEPAISVDEESLLAELDIVSEKSVQRLIDYANGRQIVVPLSAGYDSRLIVTLLRRLGHENVLTFSYGATNNHESIISKAVAESLNYPWEFVKYSNSLWQKWWLPKERKDYQWFASQWTSLPLIQDWPAVWQLKISKKIKDGAVFAPGHTGDELSGGRSVPLPEIYNLCTMDSEQVCDAIMRLRYYLFPLQSLDLKIHHLFKERVLESINAISGYLNSASAFEAWDVAERQAKFIINAVRAYEFWGYDWYLPWWDRDFMLFWQKMPLRLRKNQILYYMFVEKVYQQQCLRSGNSPVIREKKKPSTASPLRVPTLIKESCIGRFLIDIRDFYRCLREYYTHPLRWYGIQRIGGYIKVRPNEINSILALLYFSDTAERNIM